MTRKSGVAAVERALTILDAFKNRDGEALSLATLANETGFYKSTILRLIASLEDFDYIRQLDDGRYKLGHTVACLGSIYRESFQIEESVRPVLKSLVTKCKESASLVVRIGDDQQVLFRFDTKQSVRDHLREGDIVPISSGGASAKILVQFEHFSGSKLDTKSFCAFSFGERNPDMAGVAAPIFDERGFVGSLTVTGPLFRMGRAAAKRIAATLTAAAIGLSLELGASRALFSEFDLKKLVKQ